MLMRFLATPESLRIPPPSRSSVTGLLARQASLAPPTSQGTEKRIQSSIE